MNSKSSTPQRLVEKIDKALQHVFDIAAGRQRWTMRVPALPGEDSDCVLADALKEARDYIQSESGDSARVYALSDKQQRAIDETLAEIKQRGNPEPRIRMPGCEHQLDRQIEWISEGACPTCLTAECGIRGERIAALERELAEALQTRSASGAIADVAAERQRQIEKEGWSSEHDDGHGAATMAVAGACYALAWAAQFSEEAQSWRDTYNAQSRDLWPWDVEWWKPKGTRRDLVRAAALIVAEIDRLDRTPNSVDRGNKDD